ncbi:MAG: sigma-54-dependent Fis family transcriptional regulator [Candidatus Liberibacter europaeus]|uniref:DNA-binding transcriptional regulator NtrC n=1 Tax=Candidatus Liberibacter europaeus TaxID=744859 RepID=A0A2T4VX96_9HYPH|nr:sigma-54-dependent Fis family transcriptional regulator [Candidatus Liberibacter europaeus]PTL86403.1 MAG: sigma-54-dependent Fis family transcriptional regulator [Candidatus Liberibacter europaeus]
MPKEKIMDCRKRLLLIDNDYEQCSLLKKHIEDLDYDVVVVDSLQKYSEILNYDKIDAIFLSLIKFEGDSDMLLKQIVESKPTIPVIIQTRHNYLKLLICSIQNSILRISPNPSSIDQIIESIISVMESHIFYSIQEVDNKTQSLDSLIAVSPAMVRVINCARRAVECWTPVMIEGEFGVGKKMLARSIHASGSRSNFPFITVNCGMISQDKVEKVLFGELDPQYNNKMHYPGKFVEANGGTILLEEAHALPINVQEKICSFIDTGRFDFNGSNNLSKLDVRLIFSTNKNLLQEVKKDEFCKELYYKISSFPIKIPALRNRREDIPWLARFFLKLFCEQYKISHMNFSSGALSALTDYNWPDNIQELENIIFQSAIVSENFQIIEDDLIPLMFSDEKKEVKTDLEKLNRHDMERKCQNIIELDNFPSNNQYTISAINKDGEIHCLSYIEKKIIQFAMKLYQEHMSEVARRLGIGRSTLYRKIKEYNIEYDSL